MGLQICQNEKIVNPGFRAIFGVFAPFSSVRSSRAAGAVKTSYTSKFWKFSEFFEFFEKSWFFAPLGNFSGRNVGVKCENLKIAFLRRKRETYLLPGGVGGQNFDPRESWPKPWGTTSITHFFRFLVLKPTFSTPGDPKIWVGRKFWANRPKSAKIGDFG